jgi:hypothetical protein
MLLRLGLFGKTGFAAVALISAAIGAHALKPRELYREMYPLEPVKQDAFRICDDTDPTFVRAVGAEREACYNKMPHVMVVAMGRIRPGGALSAQALTDPSREAELLMTLAAMPPRQPLTVPRSFSNTAWMRALAPPCAEKRVLPAVANTAPVTLPPSPDTGRGAALGSVIGRNLPPLPRGVQSTGPQHSQLPVITLVPDGPATASATDIGDQANPAFNSLPAPDVGDDAMPAIVPLAPTGSCGGA